jgi:imidazole glycerol-phosphate synthase subunit HisF
MLKTRVIPTLTLRGQRLVKTRQFGAFRDVGDPVKAPIVYDAQLADELVYLDMDATVEGRGIDRLVKAIESISGECFMPITAGGGIRCEDDIHSLLRAGADKVSVNSAAVDSPDLVRSSSRVFGNQCIVVSIDVRREGERWLVYTRGGGHATGLDAIEWAKRAEELGAGEILLTSIDRDGTMEGYDLELGRAVTSAVSIPVILSGGAGKLKDLVDGMQVAGASALATASLFHFTDQSPIKAKAFMRRQGIAVR